MHREQRKDETKPASRKKHFLKSGDYPPAKIGSGYMVTVAGQPAIRDMAVEAVEDREEEGGPLKGSD